MRRAMYSWSGLCAVCMVCMLAACSGDDNKEDNNKTTGGEQDMGLQADMAMEQADAGGDEDATMQAGLPNTYEDRYKMRFLTLEFTPETVPAKKTTVKVLNGALKSNFNQTIDNPIVILLDVKDIDSDAGTIKLRSGAGLKTVNEEEYEWHPDTPKPFFDGAVVKENAEVTGTVPQFIFIATVGSGADATSVPLVINDLEFKATLENAEDEGEAMIMVGELKGYMTKENGDSASIEVGSGDPSPITSFFGEENLDFDSDDDGVMDSWSLFATFTARPTEID